MNPEVWLKNFTNEGGSAVRVQWIGLFWKVTELVIYTLQYNFKHCIGRTAGRTEYVISKCESKKRVVGLKVKGSKINTMFEVNFITKY